MENILNKDLYHQSFRLKEGKKCLDYLQFLNFKKIYIHIYIYFYWGSFDA